MGKNLLMIIVLLVVAGLAYLGYKSYKKESLYPTYTPEVAQKELETDIENAQTVKLEEQNYSKEPGVATWKEENGKVKFTLIMENEPEGAVQPAHIHTGACPNPGAIKFPLSNVVGGKSETTLDTTLAELKGMMPLAVNIHESSANITNYVACGNLSL